jgi:uncharacterized protein (TIGR02266 family)
VAYRIGNSIASAFTMNISPRGLSIRTANPLDIGTSLRLRFRLTTARTDIESDAHVVWSEPGKGMGVEFSAIDPGSQSAIDSYVHGHFFSNRKA